MPANLPLHEHAVAIADKDIGVREEPVGSNTGRKGRRSGRILTMQANTWIKGTRWPWCVAAWLTWALEAGFHIPYLGAGAYAFYDWAKSVGWATTNVLRARPGDGVVFNIGTGHMAQFRSYDKTTRMVHTCDGNSSDQVKLNARPLSSVRGFVLLPELPPRVSPPKKPVYEVVTSENGHAKIVYVSGEKAVSRKLGQLLNKWGGVTIRRRKPR